VSNAITGLCPASVSVPASRGAVAVPVGRVGAAMFARVQPRG
jgi:hypothetical protein